MFADFSQIWVALVCDTSNSEHFAFSGLVFFSVGYHFLLQTSQNFLDSIMGRPVHEHGKFRVFNNSSLLVNWGKVHSGSEFYGWGSMRIVRTAVDSQEIDTVIKVSVSGSDKCCVPISEGSVITFVETIRKSCSKSLLTSFELFVESEGTWH